jgi:hypothetical protein
MPRRDKTTCGGSVPEDLTRPRLLCWEECSRGWRPQIGTRPWHAKNPSGRGRRGRPLPRPVISAKPCHIPAPRGNRMQPIAQMRLKNLPILFMKQWRLWCTSAGLSSSPDLFSQSSDLQGLCYDWFMRPRFCFTRSMFQIQDIKSPGSSNIKAFSSSRTLHPHQPYSQPQPCPSFGVSVAKES